MVGKGVLVCCMTSLCKINGLFRKQRQWHLNSSTHFSTWRSGKLSCKLLFKNLLQADKKLMNELNCSAIHQRVTFSLNTLTMECGDGDTFLPSWKATSADSTTAVASSTCKWDVFTKFRAKLPAGRTDWRAFQLAFILYGGRRLRKFGGLLWKEKRAIMLCHRFWVFPGCSTKTDSCKFELVPATTACFWRNSYGLTLEARQACRRQSKQRRSVSFHHPPADASLQKQWLVAIPLTNTPHQVKGCLCLPRALRRGRPWQGCLPTIGDNVPARFRSALPHCLWSYLSWSIYINADQDLEVSLSTVSWTLHPKLKMPPSMVDREPVAPACLCGHVQFWSRDWRIYRSTPWLNNNGNASQVSE